jgi:hypothetical protein
MRALAVSVREGARARRLDGKALEAQRHGDDVDDVGLVVDHEHAVTVRGFGHGSQYRREICELSE